MYFSGALDWHVSDFPPIESDTDLFRFRRNDAWFARYAAAQLEELVERFAPDLLWNDIEWPDGGKGHEDYALAALLQRYFDRVPHGVVNDRWGVPYHGFLTREYMDIRGIQPEVWESTRGLGFSFGYNAAETPEHTLAGDALVRLLVDVVAGNGNLLINVGPRADGTIPELQHKSMRTLGRWLAANGEAVYGTRPWLRASEQHGAPVRYTSADGAVFVHALEPSIGELALPDELAGGAVSWVGAVGAGTTEVYDAHVAIPDVLRGEPVAVARVNVRR